MDSIKWDKEVDALVVGSGAGGMSAALTASVAGLDVLLIEKTDRIGGSTAISGGALWIPLNAQTEAAGHPDSFDKVWTYLQETVGAAASDEMKRAYLDAGPRMMDDLVARGFLQVAARTASPDYYPDLPGAAMGGRSLDPVEFDGRKLGRHFRTLRDPLKEFTVLGGMMVSITDVRHLLRATRAFASWRHAMKLVLRYGADRLRGYHRGTRLLLGNALAAQLFHAMLARKVPYWLDTPALALLRDADGAVLGATVEHEGRRINIRARRGVVMATGGFPWDSTRRRQTYPHPTDDWSMAPRDNTGDGIRLAEDAGAALGQGIPAPPSGRRCRSWNNLGQAPALSPPGVGPRQARPHRRQRRRPPLRQRIDFVPRLRAGHVPQPRTGADHAGLPAVRSALHRYLGLGLALPGGRPRQHLIDAGYLLQGTTLEALAQKLGVPPAALHATVARYNEYAAQGLDPDFGKGSTAYNRYLGDPEHQPNPCLAPLGAGPYYAVKVYAGDIGTACGIAANGNAQALDAAGQPIPGLYVAGNDMHSVMGGAYPAPGITLGPALTFGWVAGQHLARGQH